MTITQAGPPGKTIASLLGAPAAGPGPARRLSESPLWDHQRRFYEGTAAGIWGTSTVPHGITGNPRIANTYARIALAFLRAVQDAPAGDAGDAAHVPHVVELGGGSGRFAYLFVRQLRELAPGLRFTYVVTDFSAERVASWAAHPSYRPLVEEGLVDFAVLDADHPGPLELVVSGRTIAPGSLRGPVVGIANYVFDTLRHDAYAVRGGELRECHVAVPLDAGAPTAGDAVTGLEWDTVPCGPVPDDVARVLEYYRETLDDTAVLVPVGGMRCLDFLAGLTSGASCALVADKGHRTPVELCSHGAPSVVYHGSGFSLMVNFDFLARHVRQGGGVAILPREPARSLVVGAFVRGDVGDAAQFEASVQDQLLDTGPDNWFAVRPLLSAGPTPAVEAMLASLRLSRFDPTLLVELVPGLLEVLPGAPDAMRSEIERVLLRVWDNWFPIGEPIDMALCVGLAFSAMERFPQAVDLLETSVKEHPESAPAAFAMAVARRGLHDLRAALEWTAKALELEPGFSEARALRAMLADELGTGWES
jgi:hypothetical protein